MLYLVVFVPDKYFNSLNPIFYIHVSIYWMFLALKAY